MRILTICVILVLLLVAGLVLRHVTALDAHIEGANRPGRTFKGRRPPPPNFYEPVDYVAWVNEYIAEGKTRESAATYAGFWRDGDYEEEYMPEPPQAVKGKLRDMVRGPNWKAGEYPEVEAYISSAVTYLTVFRQEASKPGYWLQLTSDPNYPRCDGLLPDSISGQYAVWAMLAQGWREGERQSERMCDAWRFGLEHSNHLALAKLQLLHIRASFTRLVIFQSIRDALHYGVVRPEDYAVVLDLLCGTTMPHEGLTESLLNEWAFSLGLLQELYVGGKLNKTLAEMYVSLTPTGTVQLVDPMRASRVRPDKLVVAMDKYFAATLWIVDAPLSLSSLRDIRAFESVPTKLVPFDHPLRWLARPRVDRVYVQALRTLTSLRGTMTLLLIHEYRAENGRWPESLEQLDVPKDLDWLTDPFSGKQFVYKPSGGSFVLYTIGEDGIDNNGKHAEWSQRYESEVGTDFVFWPVQFHTEASDDPKAH